MALALKGFLPITYLVVSVNLKFLFWAFVEIKKNNLGNSDIDIKIKEFNINVLLGIYFRVNP